MVLVQVPSLFQRGEKLLRLPQGFRFPAPPSPQSGRSSNIHDPTELNRPGTERDEMGAEEREKDLMEEDRI